MASDSRSGKSAPQNEILINASAGETRVAIMELGHFAEFYVERERDRSVTGTVALGRVTRVLPGMQAAFVDIGLEKAAFLYVGDYLDGAAALAELDAEEEPGSQRRGQGGRSGRNSNDRQPVRIDSLLSEGQEIIVQVAKDPIGTKGARITSHVSIARRSSSTGERMKGRCAPLPRQTLPRKAQEQAQPVTRESGHRARG